MLTFSLMAFTLNPPSQLILDVSFIWFLFFRVPIDCNSRYNDQKQQQNLHQDVRPEEVHQRLELYNYIDQYDQEDKPAEAEYCWMY